MHILDKFYFYKYSGGLINFSVKSFIPKNFEISQFHICRGYRKENPLLATTVLNNKMGLIFENT